MYKIGRDCARVCTCRPWKHSFTASLVGEILAGRWTGYYKRSGNEKRNSVTLCKRVECTGVWYVYCIYSSATIEARKCRCMRLNVRSCALTLVDAIFSRLGWCGDVTLYVCQEKITSFTVAIIFAPASIIIIIRGESKKISHYFVL